ncbi:hypothetical protein HU200_060856 [Digitaria exilis]|uniref:Uncharacterized protein n=1 Tax=Digitaria exilis TaxID=1010633 RepID=A0A835AFT7_9POAL|nr:hypothetical protein HU200_060856 [Digitaria exilis]
MPCCWCSW